MYLPTIYSISTRTHDDIWAISFFHNSELIMKVLPCNVTIYTINNLVKRDCVIVLTWEHNKLPLLLLYILYRERSYHVNHHRVYTLYTRLKSFESLYIYIYHLKTISLHSSTKNLSMQFKISQIAYTYMVYIYTPAHKSMIHFYNALFRGE